MKVLVEGTLEITLPAGARGRKFDDPRTHGLSCMKAVDFIVERDDRVLYIEIKDPDQPGADRTRRAEFARRFKAGEIDFDLARKFRDSFLYEWACKAVTKPVHYLVLVAMPALDQAMLLARTEALQRVLPLEGPANGAWKRQVAKGCLVFNVEAWNRALPDLSISRVGG